MKVVLMPQATLGLALAVLMTAFSARADGGKVESIGPFADQSASESVRKSFEPKGYRVTLADGTPLCEIWLRNGVPAAKSEAGTAYAKLGDSSLVGAISFLKDASDFRGQAIKAGVYTLRHALHPADGNHLGISQVRDFLLLTPVTVDQNADAEYKFEELAKMSAKASGTNHPAVLSLVLSESKPAPALVENEHGHLVFVTKIRMQQGAEMPIAFVLKGVAEQ
jgi:hypothetical protein